MRCTARSGAAAAKSSKTSCGPTAKSARGELSNECAAAAAGGPPAHHAAAGARPNRHALSQRQQQQPEQGEDHIAFLASALGHRQHLWGLHSSLTPTQQQAIWRCSPMSRPVTYLCTTCPRLLPLAATANPLPRPHLDAFSLPYPHPAAARPAADCAVGAAALVCAAEGLQHGRLAGAAAVAHHGGAECCT